MRTYSLFVLIAFPIIIMATLGCTRREDIAEKIVAPVGQLNQMRIRAYGPDILSLSIAGPSRALILTRSDHRAIDLRLTTDGGQRWQLIQPGKPGDALTATTMTQSGLTLGVSSRGEILTINVPDRTWSTFSNPSRASEQGFGQAEQIEFPTDTDGWILDALHIWHTKDGGNSWETSLSNLTEGVNGQPTRIVALAANAIAATGTKGQFYRTEDGGRTWQIQTLSLEGDFRDVSFADRRNGVAVGYVGEPSFRPLVFVTKDGGVTWREVFLQGRILPWSVSFIKGEIWLAGDERVKSADAELQEPVLLHTMDGGLHWERVAVNSGDPYFSLVRFANREHGWLVDRDNLYRTDDAGKTWRVVFSLAPIQKNSN